MRLGGRPSRPPVPWWYRGVGRGCPWATVSGLPVSFSPPGWPARCGFGPTRGRSSASPGAVSWHSSASHQAVHALSGGAVACERVWITLVSPLQPGFGCVGKGRKQQPRGPQSHSPCGAGAWSSPGYPHGEVRIDRRRIPSWTSRPESHHADGRQLLAALSENPSSSWRVAHKGFNVMQDTGHVYTSPNVRPYSGQF